MNVMESLWVVSLVNCFYCIFILYIAGSWGGHKSRQADLVEKGTWWVGIRGRGDFDFETKY